MDFFFLAGATLLIGFVAIFAVAIVTYMASLVKNAYEIKVEIRAEMESGMRRISDLNEKWSRATKRELIDEVGKGRVILENENTRYLGELADAIKKQLYDLDEAVRHDRASTLLAFDELRNRMGEVEYIYRSIVRPKTPEKEKPKEEALTSDLDPAKAMPISDLDPAKAMPIKTADVSEVKETATIGRRVPPSRKPVGSGES